MLIAASGGSANMAGSDAWLMEHLINNLPESTRLIPKLHHPATFLERGVSLPFTTPLLAGARARPSTTDRVELILLNPAGGRGVYILPWRAIDTFCRPTLHDAIFNERVAALPWVTPLLIRRAARQVAVEGLAGENAMVSADGAKEAEKSDLILANYQLLVALHEQVGAGLDANSPDGLNRAARLRLAVDLVSKRLGRDSDWTATALEDIADLMAALGVSPAKMEPRIERQMNLLEQVRGDVQRWTAMRADDVEISCGRMVQVVAGLTLQLAETTLAAARSLTTDMEDLLRRWSTAPEVIRDLVTRPEWLLDGWERVCLLWNAAGDEASRSAAMAEIADLVPIMPKEVNAWGVSHNEDREVIRRRRVVPINEDWLTGATVFDLIARNEQLGAARS